ncbi:1-phosphofructokinase family hexose kinase (plasmid) [Fusobacteria bacterium ZRK30]|nr:1-phosphofructokinase family hexose kinase [Fusobacteria bacterium ZRK30]
MILTVTMNPAIDKIYTVENFQLGEVHRPTEMIASAGGKGLNVTRVAKLMGEDVAATGLLGGSNGLYIDKKVQELQVKSKFGQIDGETRICINVTDSVNQFCTEILEKGPTISNKEANDFITKFSELIKEASVITISGSLPKGLPTNFYSLLIEKAKKHNKKVLLDTSSEALLEGIKSKPYIIKPNGDEIRDIYNVDINSDEKLIEMINFFKNEGIELPIISRGKDGAIAGLSDGIYQVITPIVQTINTVGSGDSFIAGCAIGIERGLSEIDILKMGAACGTANTQYIQTGYVEPKVVTDYFNQIKVNKIIDYFK